MTSKTRTLTDPDGYSMKISHLGTNVRLTALNAIKGVESEIDLDPADLIAAIREVTGTPEPESMTTVQSLRATIAELYSEIVKRDRQIERLEAAKSKPAPSTPPTAEDFARARFAEVDGNTAARWVVDDDAPWATPQRGGWLWYSDLLLADLASQGRARIIREAPTDPATLIDLAWEAAHPVPEGVRVPPHTPCVERSDDGRSTFAPDGFSFDADAHGTGWEIRTFAPLPAPRPEGAERIEAIIADQSLGFNADDITALADRIAQAITTKEARA